MNYIVAILCGISMLFFIAPWFLYEHQLPRDKIMLGFYMSLTWPAILIVMLIILISELEIWQRK